MTQLREKKQTRIHQRTATNRHFDVSIEAAQRTTMLQAYAVEIRVARPNQILSSMVKSNLCLKCS